VSLHEIHWFSRLATIVPAGQNWATKIHLGRDSTALRVLFELVVPPWPLIVWVVFRTMVPDRTDPLETFLDFLRGPNRDLFAWDDVDAAVLYRALVKHSELGLFPRDWNQYMVEIDFGTWRQITTMTRTVDRPRRQPENLWIRLAAVSVEFSATLSIPRNILAPFNLSPKQFPLASITHVVHENYKTQCALGTFESKEFWAASNVRRWLSGRRQDLCHAIWLSSHLSVLERVQFMYLVFDRTVLPKVSSFVRLSFFA
jgi:hypothetical protein